MRWVVFEVSISFEQVLMLVAWVDLFNLACEDCAAENDFFKLCNCSTKYKGGFLHAILRQNCTEVLARYCMYCQVELHERKTFINNA